MTNTNRCQLLSGLAVAAAPLGTALAAPHEEDAELLRLGQLWREAHQAANARAMECYGRYNAMRPGIPEALSPKQWDHSLGFYEVATDRDGRP
jgi:hypothetical protein